MPKVVPSPSGLVAADADVSGWIGEYQLLVEIAQTDLAAIIVARARNAQPDSHPVAVHRYHDEIASDPEFCRLLSEELVLVATLAHRNVLAPREVIHAEPLSVVMDLLDGGTLAMLLEHAREHSTRLPLPIVLRVLIDVLSGLHAAHQKLDIVHRAVSPHAVFVGDDGIARVTDVGMARARSYAAVSSERPIDEYAAYKAPEQFDSRAVTPLADVYSSAEVLWEALAGRPRFGGGSVAASLKARAQIMPPSSLVPELPSELDEVVLKALDNDPNARFGTAAEFAVALSACGVALATKEEVAAYVRTVVGGAMARRRALWTTVQVACSQLTHPDAAPAEAASSENPAAARSPVEKPAIAKTPAADASVRSAARAAWSASWGQEPADNTGVRPAIANKTVAPVPAEAASPRATSPSVSAEPGVRALAPPPRSSVTRGATRLGVPVPAPPAPRVPGPKAPVASPLRAPTPAPVASPLRAPTPAAVASPLRAPTPAAVASPLRAPTPAPVASPPAAGTGSIEDPDPLFGSPRVRGSAPAIAHAEHAAASPTAVAALAEPAPALVPPVGNQSPMSAVSEPIVTPSVRQPEPAAKPASRTIMDGTPQSSPASANPPATMAHVQPAVAVQTPATRAAVVQERAFVPPTDSRRMASPVGEETVRRSSSKRMTLLAAIGVGLALAGGLWAAARSRSQPVATARATMAPSAVHDSPQAAGLPTGPVEAPSADRNAVVPEPVVETGSAAPVIDTTTGHHSGSGHSPGPTLAPAAAPTTEPAPPPEHAPAPRRRRREYRPGTV